MKPAVYAILKRHRLRCNAGFTLIEIIISLVVAGVLASIAGMGIVSAMGGYALVRENISLSQKIQLATTRIHRELLELTDIIDRDDTRPYIVYDSPTGQRQAIAKVADTIKLYTDPPEMSETYLTDNGDILTDRVASFTLNFFQGPNDWDGNDIRELSAIQFSLNLFHEAVAGGTVNVATWVHLRNNDNYGGSVASLPAAPPSGGQYTCFIATLLPGPGGVGFTATRPSIGWVLFMLPFGWVLQGVFIKKRVHPVKASGQSSHQVQGSALIGIIIVILVFAALGAAIVPMISSSQLHRTATGRSAQAYYLAESGMRYAASRYLNATTEAAKYTLLNNLHGVTHRLQDNRGVFTVSVSPYYFLVDVDATSTMTLYTRFYGDLADVDAVTGGGSLSVDGMVFPFTSAILTGNQLTFNLSSAVSTSADTPVYPVARASAPQTVSNGGDLSLLPGTGHIFPEHNGAFVLNGETYTYRENSRGINRLRGIKRSDGSAFADIELLLNTDIRLKKFVKATATGAVGSGDMLASRQIVYHIQIPEEKEPSRITFHEKFDNLEKWSASLAGTHEIVDLNGNPVLRVTGVLQPGVNVPSVSLIALNTAGVQFNPEHFDTQVKIGYVATASPPTHGYDPQPVPKYFSAGLCFRLLGNGNTYGLSFQRGNVSVSPPDNIDNNLIPANDMLAVVLWQATNNGTDKQWLAYKRLSDVSLDSSAEEISAVEWVDNLGKQYSDPITDIASVPELPCDYRRIKLKFSRACDPDQSDCTMLEVSIDGGESWILTQDGEVDLTSFAGQAIRGIQFRINTGAIGWHIFNLGFTADAFKVENATLVARFNASASITFDTGGPDMIEPGDRIIGISSSASATVYGAPVLQSGSWAANNAAGSLLLDNVNGLFRLDEQITVAGKSPLATLRAFRAQDHYIKGYFGTESGCGTPNSNPLDGDKRPSPLDPAALNWPPDEGSQWGAENDYFQLIQWDELNLTSVDIDLVNSADEPNTLLRNSAGVLMGSGSTLGLHTFGKGSRNIYFDDFGYQSFVDKPVAISQPLQY
ncbi:type II secretion system protein J [Desulfosarcina sp.]|uniref:PulJ/GspJ family protein n=1 Tax=Desulfosarcina sp. TaxID=2027861 RepID=UPI003970B81E